MYEVLVRRIIQQELNKGVSLTPDPKEKLEKLRTPSTSTQEERKIISDELESSAEFSSFVIQAFEKVEKSDSAMANAFFSEDDRNIDTQHPCCEDTELGGI